MPESTCSHRLHVHLFATVLALLGGGARTLSAENIVFPAEARTVIDVTQAPYHCDNTGREDCTAALVRALNDILSPSLIGQRAIEAEIRDDPRQTFVHPSSVENRKIDGKWQAIFPAELNPARILYFPNGTYRVSDTIGHTLDNLRNTWGNELNRQIVIQGQSEKGTIIRLADESPGFEAGTGKPVLSFIRGDLSNVAMMNVLQNITINTGRGNPGAAALRFFSNNSGAVRHVTLTTDDPQRRGVAGLLLDRFNLSASYIRHLTVEGFDYGIQAVPSRIYAVLEHITLRHQRRAGILVNELILPIRGLDSLNHVPALTLHGRAAHVVLLDSTLRHDDTVTGPTAAYPAIEHHNGVLFARAVETPGYPAAVGRFGQTVLADSRIEEYSSHGVLTLSGQTDARSLNLPVRNTPDMPWVEDLDQWISVNATGAAGDGVTDDTAAIQRALDAGEPVVWFQPGRYRIDGQLTIPAGVLRLNFMYADLVAGPALRAMSDQGAFVVAENDFTPLVIENLFAFEGFRGEHYLIDHATTRTLILRDLHTQTGALYTNSASGGEVFIENVASTDQFAPHPNPISFHGQTVWARQLNPERGFPQVLNDGGSLWVLGFKTEGHGAGFHTRRGGATEILGGASNMGGSGFLLTENAAISASFATTGWKIGDTAPAMAVEHRGDLVLRLHVDELPQRIGFYHDDPSGFTRQFHVPLYVGRPLETQAEP